MRKWVRLGLAAMLIVSTVPAAACTVFSASEGAAPRRATLSRWGGWAAIVAGAAGLFGLRRRTRRRWSAP